MTTTRTAHAAFTLAVSRLDPPSLHSQPSSTDLLLLAEHVEKVRSLTDDYFAALAAEAGVPDVDALAERAERTEQDEREVAVNRRGWAKARLMGVD